MDRNISKDLLNLINDYKGEPYNVCYKVIDETDDFERDFYFLCDLLTDHSIGHIDVPEYISTEEYKNLYLSTLTDTERIFNDLFYKVNHAHLDPKQAFSQLAERFQNRFADKKTLAIAVSLIALGPHVPFVSCGNLIKMNDSEYKQRLVAHSDLVDKLRYTIQVQYAQKTERASAILNILSSVKSPKNQAVLLSQLLWMIENKKYYLRVVNSNETEEDSDLEGMDDFLSYLHQNMFEFLADQNSYDDYGDDYYDKLDLDEDDDDYNL